MIRFLNYRGGNGRRMEKIEKKVSGEKRQKEKKREIVFKFLHLLFLPKGGVLFGLFMDGPRFNS